MLKQRRLAAEKIAAELFAAEAAIDAAIAATARLAAVMPVARQEAGMAPHFGHDAVMRSVATMTKLAEARAAIIATHDALAETQKQAGLREVNFLGGDKPPAEDFGWPKGHLRAVA